MVGDFGWEHEGTKSGGGTVKAKDISFGPYSLSFLSKINIV